MPRYELVYFGVKAIVEVPRLLMVDQGMPFTDVFVDRANEWPAMKSSMPFGQLPVLKIDGGSIVLAQSMAICRYLAREAGLTPSDSLEQAICDMYTNQIEDGMDRIIEYVYNNWDTGRDNFIADVPGILSPFEARLEKSGDFIMPSGISLADYSLYHLLDNIVAIKSDSLDATPLLKTFYKQFKERPKIKAYHEDEKYKNMTFWKFHY